MSTAQTAAQAALAAILAKRAAGKPALPAPASSTPVSTGNAATQLAVQQPGPAQPKQAPIIPAVRIPPIDSTSETVLARMELIEKALLSNDPNMRQYLVHMHQQLLKFPELLYVLQPDQIGIVVKAATRVAGIELTTSETKRKERSERASLKKLDTSDL